MRTITLRFVSKHAKNDHAGAFFEFNSERWFQGSRAADLRALITRQRTRTNRPRRIQPRRRSGPVNRVFPERVELAGKSPSRNSSGQAAGFECTMSRSANLEIMITIIHWGAF
jgi:hypothetical protein